MTQIAEAKIADGLAPGARVLATIALCLSTAMAVLDVAIANIALPTIAVSLHASPAVSIWVVNAYQLAVTVMLLPFAALGDSLGFRRVYMVGLVAFTAASLGCSLADSLPALIVARVAQGLGAAGIISVNMAIVRQVYPRNALGRGIGYVTLTVALSAAAGPSVAAALLSIAPWPFLFAINVPIGIAAFALGARVIPAIPGSGAGFDWVSAALNVAMFGLLVMLVDGFSVAGDWPLRIANIAALLAVGVLYVRRSFAQSAPMLPVDLLSKRMFALSVVTSICSYSAQTLAYVGLPFLFQMAGERSQLATGLLITPWPAVVVFVAPLAGRLSDRYPAGLLGGIGLAIMSAGMIALTTMPLDTSFVDVAWRMMLAGIGFGFFQSPNNRALAGGAPANRAGAASGTVSTARLLGQSLGAAMVALCFGFSGTVESGSRIALALGAGFAALGMAVSLSRLRDRG
jgi:DHA2 family multidrug resistance protein-like MFS transporter